jgi:sugar O-acyltransferase (sialic acid O-acetyltransferase NeuD family)
VIIGLNKKPIKNVVIVGAGDFGREVLEIFKAKNKVCYQWNILGFVDDDQKLQGKLVSNYPVHGNIEWLNSAPFSDIGCVCSIGLCEVRKEIVQKIQKYGIPFVNAVHPSVTICDFVHLGKGVIIQAGAILGVNSFIGDQVHVNFHGVIGHDVIINPFCTIGTKATINGHDQLGEGVFVGSGATFLQNLTIGEWTTVGAGAVVINDLAAHVVAVGVPARVIKNK